jgi:hypothetical protein
MHRRLKLAALLAAAALALTLGLRQHGVAPTAPAVGAPAAQNFATQKHLEAVERLVAERNSKNGQIEKGLVDAGWVMTTSTPPDPRLERVDPSLIAAGREAELRWQLASGVPQAANAHNMAQIVLLAHDPATRESAVDALGVIRTPEAKDELIGLLTGGKLDAKDLGRSQIPSRLVPSDLEDETAAKIAGLLDNKALTPVEKKQLAFNLALVALRDGTRLPENVTTTMSPQAVALVEQMTEVAQRQFVAVGHAHEIAHE